MLLRVALIVGIIAFVVGRQLIGEPLRGRRVLILPIVLTVVGVTDLSSGGHRVQPVDVLCLIIGAVLAAGIGLAQGAVMRIESRNGYLWGQLPSKGLLLWCTLVTSRIAMTGVALGLHAHIAASSATILLMLGINRLGQAGAVIVRAMGSGIPFAPEKDGKSILVALTGPAPRSTGRAPGSRGHDVS
jgi:hypothetical protein